MGVADERVGTDGGDGAGSADGGAKSGGFGIGKSDVDLAKLLLYEVRDSPAQTPVRLPVTSFDRLFQHVFFFVRSVRAAL